MKSFHVVLLVVLLTAKGAFADLLASYPFTAGSVSSIDTNPNSTASAVTDTKTYIGASASASNAFILAYDGATAVFSTNFTSAVNNDRYFQFSLSTDPGYVANLDTLSFNYGGAANSQASYTSLFQVRSSLDNYVNPLGTSTGVVVAPSASALNTPGVFSLDLSGNPSFQGITGVTFRIYGVFENPTVSGSPGFTSTQNGSLRLDNLALTGSVVPEPSTALLMMLGVGALAYCRVRRGQ